MHTFWHLFVLHLEGFIGFWQATILNNLAGLAFVLLAAVWAVLTLNFRHIDDVPRKIKW